MEGADPAEPLFALPPADFVAARDRLASELKKAGKKDEAAAVKALGRPAVSVFAVNQLARAHPEPLAKFLAASDELRRAQISGQRSDQGRKAYQDSVRTQRSALEVLLDLAARLLEDAGLAAGKPVLDKIANNLRWGALEDESRALIASGHLRIDVAAPDFAALLGAAAPGEAAAEPVLRTPAEHAVPLPRAARDRAPGNASHAPSAAEEAAARREAAARAQAAKKEVLAVRKRLHDAEAAARRARDKADATAKRLAQAQARVGELRAQIAAAERALQEAETEKAEATRAAAAEEQEIAALQAELARAEAAAR